MRHILFGFRKDGKSSFRILAATVAGFYFSVAISALGQDRNSIKAPINIAHQQSLFLKSSPAPICPAAVPVPSKIETLRYYIDDANSIVDPKLYAREMQQEHDLRSNAYALMSLIDALAVDSQPTSEKKVGDCIVKFLRNFADGRAYLDSITGNQEEWRGTGLVRLVATNQIFAYAALKTSNYKIDPDDDRAIRNWFDRLSPLIINWVHSAPYDNNIDYWAGAYLAVAAFALNKVEYLDEALSIARDANAHVSANGTLPAEMQRGDLSLTYSLFAAEPLTLILAVAKENGVNIDLDPQYCNLIKFLDVMFMSVDSPEKFLMLSHNSNSISPDKIFGSNYAWIVIWQNIRRYFPYIKKTCDGTLQTWNGGGDWFLVFGDPRECPVAR